jgi:hypothetical protein
MKIYIANGTNQIQRFFYRVPGPQWSREIEIVIPQGMQMAAISMANSSTIELLPEEGEAIIEQLERYGAVKSDDMERVNRTKPVACMCYSIGKPVSPPKIEKLFHHNKAVMEKRSEDGLLAQALANDMMTNERIEEVAREARRPLPDIKLRETSITEVPRSGSPRKTGFFRNGKDASGTIRIAGS